MKTSRQPPANRVRWMHLTNVTKWQQAFSNGHPVIVNKLGTVYGTDYLVIIGQQTNTDVTVSPDGTVTVKSH